MSENDIQRSIVDYLRAVVPRALVMAIPNASKRSVGGRASNAVPGLLAGAPDLLMVVGPCCYFIEVKTDKGKLSDAQSAVLQRMTMLGVRWAVVRSIDEMRVALLRWQVETKEHRLSGEAA